MTEKDTIAAIATSLGQGAIGIIRISGEESLCISKKIFTSASKTKDFKSYRLYYGTILDVETSIDTGFFVYMKAPHSYTGEDTVELYCHGGALILKKILETVLKNGARCAEPGEFTKRAFLNGKLDLTQAEAVIDVIRAKSELALLSAQKRLDGKLSKKISLIKQSLLRIAARVEAAIDFPEDSEEIPKEKFLDELNGAEEKIKDLLDTYEEGRALKQGVRVVILGRPNVGKSSILNILLKEERAIVTDEPGTTRDVIEEVVIIKGIPVRLMDTAGLRDAAGRVESIGVEKAKKKAKEAELILYAVDSFLKDFKEDLALLKSIQDKKIIVVADKMDIADNEAFKTISDLFTDYPLVFVSALKEENVDILEDKIFCMAAGGVKLKDADEGEVITSVREKDALESALSGIDKVKTSINKKLPEEIIAEDLRWTLDRLKELTGEITTDDILDKIFKEFCVGK